MTKVYNLDGTVKGEVKLPHVFSYDYRPDLIKRAVLAIQSHKRQPYGVDPLAGKRTSAHYHGARRIPYAMMNREMARMARSHGGSPGQDFRARFVPQARGGRVSHPPKVEKIWYQKINDKERKLAIKSAIAATSLLDLVKRRHHIPDLELPVIVSDNLESVKKFKELEKLLTSLNIYSDLERSKNKKVRAGKGKMRGRRYKIKKSILFVVSKDNGIVNAVKNVPGIDVCLVKDLNAELLAPGSLEGRLTLWSESAIKQLGELYG